MRIQTFRQFAIDIRRSKVAEFGITMIEATEFYPDVVLVGEWWKYVEKAFNDGADFTRQAVRGLTDAQLRSLSRTTRALRQGLPRYYAVTKRAVVAQ